MISRNCQRDLGVPVSSLFKRNTSARSLISRFYNRHTIKDIHHPVKISVSIIGSVDFSIRRHWNNYKVFMYSFIYLPLLHKQISNKWRTIIRWYGDHFIVQFNFLYRRHFTKLFQIGSYRLFLHAPPSDLPNRNQTVAPSQSPLNLTFLFKEAVHIGWWHFEPLIKTQKAHCYRVSWRPQWRLFTVPPELRHALKNQSQKGSRHRFPIPSLLHFIKVVETPFRMP